jgi:type IV secretion system protein VirB11
LVDRRDDHPGSMTTVHADSPRGAIEQITLLALQGGTQLSRADVHHYVRSTIDLYVQLGRSGGRRYISQVVRGSALGGAG